MKKYLVWMLGLFAAVLVVTAPARNGGLLNYDDERYIANNPWLDPSLPEPGSVWTSFFDGHYHPLTLLSLQLDDSFGGDPIMVHHSVNWILHGLNAVLLFWFLVELTGNTKLALSVALLWGLHPMAVESYAWMTERKNVLYTAFFMLSVIQYLKFTQTKSNKYFGLTGLFFLLSLLSKGQAITLVPVFLLVDYYKGGNLFANWKSLIGFAIVAVGFVYLGRQAQMDAWDLSNQTYGIGDRLIMGAYAFTTYTVNTVLPLFSSPFNPYPVSSGGEIGMIHYLSFLVLAGYVFALIQTYRKGARLWFFGLAWYGVNVVLLLKILEVPYGAYFMANRYAYVPMMGLLLPVVQELLNLVKSKTKVQNGEWYVVGILAVLFALGTRVELKKWSSSTELWSAVIEAYPEYPDAYNMLALGYVAEGDPQNAILNFEELSQVLPEAAEGPINLAVLFEQMDAHDRAEQYLSEALRREPENEQVLEKAAIIYMRRGKLDEALEFSSRGIALYPESEELVILHSQVLARLGRISEAIGLLESQPQDVQVVQLISQLRQLERSKSAPSSTPQRGTAKMYMDQGVQAAQSGNVARAMENFNKAIETDPTMFEAYANRGSYLARSGNLPAAEADFLKALELNPQSYNVMSMLGMLYGEKGEVEKSCAYYRKAAEGIQIDPRILDKCSGLGL